MNCPGTGIPQYRSGHWWEQIGLCDGLFALELENRTTTFGTALDVVVCVTCFAPEGSMHLLR